MVAQDPPSNKGVGPDTVAFTLTDNPERLVSIGDETTSIAVKAMPDNNGNIFVSFSGDDGTDVGFPLAAGEGITLDVDANQEGIYASTDTIGDEVRWIALN